MTLARVQPRGQVTIPRDIRQACGVEPGTDLLFTQTGPDSFQCQKVPRQSIVEIIERLSVPGTAPDLTELREEMGDEVARELGLRVRGAWAPRT